VSEFCKDVNLVFVCDYLLHVWVLWLQAQMPPSCSSARHCCEGNQRRPDNVDGRFGTAEYFLRCLKQSIDHTECQFRQYCKDTLLRRV
jgi:hypothetical protein